MNKVLSKDYDHSIYLFQIKINPQSLESSVSFVKHLSLAVAIIQSS